MANMHPYEMKKALQKQGVPINVLVETGTLRADTTLKMRPLFKIIHTVELSAQLWRENVERYSKTGIQFWFGDSELIVPVLSNLYKDQPIAWYLDAHWYIPGEDREYLPIAWSSPFPLWVELEVIRQRKQPDLLVVDDLHAFGKEAEENKGWRDVTKESLDRFLGSRLDGPSDIIFDQYIAYLGASE